MRMKYFGDSYDIVKQSLLRWLGSFGPWSALPMFTEAVTPEEVAKYASLLSVSGASDAVLSATDDRAAYFATVPSGSVFLDPNTGLRLSEAGTRRTERPNFVLADELIALCQRLPGSLTLTFDQSLPHGAEQPHLERKLRYLCERGVHAFAYHSHACFIIAGSDRELVRRARAEVLLQSRLPEHRLVVSVESFTE